MVSSANAQFIDTKWTVVKSVGEAWFEKPKNVIGKTQEFYKGWADGYFFQCDYEGQSATYTKYSLNQFFNNPEFEIFKKEKNNLSFSGKNIFVHRISCNGNKRILYPFVTVEPGNKAYYLFEGAIYILEYKKNYKQRKY
jgi:hypothetical protein